MDMKLEKLKVLPVSQTIEILDRFFRIRVLNSFR